MLNPQTAFKIHISVHLGGRSEPASSKLACTPPHPAVPTVATNYRTRIPPLAVMYHARSRYHAISPGFTVITWSLGRI